MTSTPTSRLLSLAPELVEHVIKQISKKKDLSNLRLVCSTLDKYAVNELFKDVFLTPSEEHISTWNYISEHDAIRRIPRYATIQTQPDIKNDDFYREDMVEIGEEFEAAVAALASFPNIDSLEIAFAPQCLGEEEEEEDDSMFMMERRPDRKKAFQIIFQAIRNRAGGDNRTIRKLTIINLQNRSIPEFTSSDLFGEVLRHLDELHIKFIYEENHDAPDNDMERVELRTFPAQFIKQWLGPISSNLRALSVYHRNSNWGPFPGYWNFSELSFPKLESLTLGYYTIAHDNDIDWILAIKSLRKLILQNCMIVSWIRFDPDTFVDWKVKAHDWVDLPYESEYEIDDVIEYKSFSHKGTWAQVFDRFATLPSLEDFQFNYAGPYTEDYGIKQRDNCGRRVFPERYVTFDEGILPNRWPEADSQGEMESWAEGGFPKNMHKEELEADQASLDSFIKGLGNGREE